MVKVLGRVRIYPAFSMRLNRKKKPKIAPSFDSWGRYWAFLRFGRQIYFGGGDMPECQSISRESGRSFLTAEGGGNTTSFAGNAKGAASRASAVW